MQETSPVKMSITYVRANMMEKVDLKRILPLETQVTVI